MSNLRIVYLAPGGEPEIRTIEHSLENMQAQVEGMLDCVQIDPVKGIDCWVNDEGLLIGMPINIMANEDFGLAGPVFFAKSNDEGETVSLSDEDVAWVHFWLRDIGRIK